MGSFHRKLPEPVALTTAGTVWAKLPVIGLVMAAIGLGGAAAMGWGSKQFLHSYLVAYMYGLSLALGALFFVLIQFATRAGWSVTVRRIAENLALTLPVLFVLFLPIFLGMDTLFEHWLHPHDSIVQGKVAYLNKGSFLIRAAVYFVIWCGMAAFYWKHSTKQDTTGDIEHTRKMQAFSYPGIILFTLSLTFASFDWVMSLDPHWFSTMFGVYYFAGSVVGMFALMSVLTLLAIRTGLLRGVVDQEHMHDLGKFTFAFTVFWTYIAFSQYFLIWYANIPEETMWYAHRLHGSWMTMGKFMLVGHFILPFLFLIPRTVKRHPLGLLFGATWMLGLHFLDLHWQIMPVIHEEFSFHAMDALTLLGVCGAMLAGFGYFLSKASVVPLKDPRLHEALNPENF